MPTLEEFWNRISGIIDLTSPDGPFSADSNALVEKIDRYWGGPSWRDDEGTLLHAHLSGASVIREGVLDDFVRLDNPRERIAFFDEVIESAIHQKKGMEAWTAGRGEVISGMGFNIDEALASYAKTVSHVDILASFL
ncbi:hypothetical protein OHV05_37925 (plasmid) [Kitasatospora sp. NBC_00070]|uniref:hypothetical protein n=1 Tax=Kitasatospora sp. NBC_00070 TaxID=2975962 RepID=UPI002F918F62